MGLGALPGEQPEPGPQPGEGLPQGLVQLLEGLREQGPGRRERPVEVLEGLPVPELALKNCIQPGEREPHPPQEVSF